MTSPTLLILIQPNQTWNLWDPLLIQEKIHYFIILLQVDHAIMIDLVRPVCRTADLMVKRARDSNLNLKNNRFKNIICYDIQLLMNFRNI